MTVGIALSNLYTQHTHTKIIGVDNWSYSLLHMISGLIFGHMLAG